MRRRLLVGGPAWRGLNLLIPALILLASTTYASYLDTIGLTLLRATTTNLNGSGVGIAQVEAQISNSSPAPFEVNPANASQPGASFAYFVGPPTTITPASANSYPNSVGSESGHADAVGGLFYGRSAGVSTNASHIDNYEAEYFFATVVPGSVAINDSVINQSFILSSSTSAEQEASDANYDNYAVQYNALFVSGVGNAGGVNPPSTCYNGIGVGAYQGSSSTGPTAENGRAKPDIVAPGAETSYSSPLVSGAATILLQAALRGDGGSDTNSAADIRTLKALLLNGAIKPTGWSNPVPSPLDPLYGAGVLNVFNSYRQLVGGKHAFNQSSTVSTGAAHPPLSGAGTISNLTGWDLNSISSSALSDAINHYYFDLGATNSRFVATFTLVWNRQAHQTSINNLDLFLYERVSGSLIASSVSTVDNVEHIYLLQLPQGRYDLQVLKHGGATISISESYAVAFDFSAQSLAITQSGQNVALAWPTYPAGFTLESAPNLSPSATWTVLNQTPLVVNNQNIVVLSPGGGSQFFRLSRP